MTLADLIKRIMDAGASSTVVAIVTEAFEVLSHSVPWDTPDNERDKKRKRERERKRKQRDKRRLNGPNAEANDAAPKPGQKRDMQPDISAGRGSLRCDSSFLPSLLPESKGNRESKKEANARARGTRLSADAPLSTDDRAFAVQHGVEPDAAWVEFRDYWTGIPGQRGVKLSWGGTWRNRVRELKKRNGGQNGKRGSNAAGGARGSGSSVFARMAGYENQGDLRPEPRPPVAEKPFLELTAENRRTGSD